MLQEVRCLVRVTVKSKYYMRSEGYNIEFMTILEKAELRSNLNIPKIGGVDF